MKYVEDIPTQVSINEAVELSKRFDTEDSYTFVNGVLGAIEKYLSENSGDSDNYENLKEENQNSAEVI